jgi:glycosyltransferase involved in cell wall biosynthesis
MHLLYPITAYPPSTGGAQIHTHLLAQELARRHTVQVVSHWDTHRTDWLLGTTLRAPGYSRDYSLDGVPVHRLGFSPWEKLALAPYVPLFYPLMNLALPPVAAAIARHLAPFGDSADLIHNVRIGREGISQAAFDLARQRDVPFVLTPNHHPRWVGWRYRIFLRLYREADALIALTESERRVLVGLGVSEERIAVTGIGPVLAEQANGGCVPSTLRDRGWAAGAVSRATLQL